MRRNIIIARKSSSSSEVTGGILSLIDMPLMNGNIPWVLEVVERNLERKVIHKE